MAVRIGHASIDEKGSAKYGEAGDQTGKEVCIRDWYNHNWDFVLRPKNATIAEKSAVVVEKLAKSNLVGYDQNQRNTLHTQMKSNGYNVDKYIKSKIKAETDCSAFMTLAAITAGVKKLEYITNAPTTTTMKNFFVASGEYELLVGYKYTSTSDLLKRGDILVKAGSHTVMALDNGAKVVKEDKTTTTANKTTTTANKTTSEPYKVGKSYKTKVALNIRSSAKVGNNKKKLEKIPENLRKNVIKSDSGHAVLKPETTVTCKEVVKQGTNYWLKTSYGYIAAQYSGKTYIK